MEAYSWPRVGRPLLPTGFFFFAIIEILLSVLRVGTKTFQFIYSLLLPLLLSVSMCVRVCLHVTVHIWSEDRGQLCGVPSPRAQSQVAIRVRSSTFFVKPFGRPNLCTIANICPRNLCIVIRFEIIIPAPNFPKAALLVQKVFRH